MPLIETLTRAERDFRLRNDTGPAHDGVLREEWELAAIEEVCRTCPAFSHPRFCADWACADKVIRPLPRRRRCPRGRWAGWRKPPVGVMPWEALWRLHEGKTFLVVGRGPSRDEVDLASVERDITIATNLSLWETQEQLCTHFDYDVSTDEGPCRLARPKGVRLISNANTAAGRANRANSGCWCVFPHHVYGWGPIARGKKLPTAFNSGLAAIALALYMGAARVKVVGINYSPWPGGGMHANDADEVARRRSVKQFDRTFVRVQKAARRLAGWCADHGVRLEILSSSSRLDWTLDARKDEPSDIKLYPGAGTHRREGFIHADIRPGVAERVMDICVIPWRLDGEPLGDGAVAHLFLSHTLEHVPFRKVEAILDECARVVRAGGLMEIRVPDLRAVCEWALGAKWLNQGHIARIFGAQDFPENTHLGGFDALSLERALWHAGFEEIRIERIPREKRDRGMELRALTRRRAFDVEGSKT